LAAAAGTADLESSAVQSVQAFGEFLLSDAKQVFFATNEQLAIGERRG
jgi:hypothetical protein